MAEIKKVWTTIRSIDCDALARYLEYMAEDGWRFASWENNCLTFEKAEAETSVYDVQVVPELKYKGYQILKDDENGNNKVVSKPEEVINDSDSPVTDKLDGWEWIADQDEICILKRVKEDATPILTDAQKLQNVRNAYSKKSNLICIFLLAAIIIYMLPNVWSNMQVTLFNNWTLVVIPLALVGIIYLLADIILTDSRFKKAEIKIEHGEKVFFGKMSKKNPRVPAHIFTNLWAFYFYSILFCLIFLVPALLFIQDVVSTVVIILFVYTFEFIGENIQPKKKRDVCFVVLALLAIIMFALYIFGDFDSDDYYFKKSESVLGCSCLHNYLTDENDDYICEYNYYHLNSYVPESVTDVVWNAALDGYDDYLSLEYHVKSLKEKYHAKDAAYGKKFHLLALEYDHGLITIEDTNLLTDEQIQELVDKLE